MNYAALETALLTALGELRTSHDVKTLESYGGEFSPDSFGEVPINYPAVYLCIGGMDSESANRIDNRTISIDVYVASRSLRGETAARRGDSKNGGAYALIEGVRAKLNRLAIPGFGIIVLRREALLGYSKTAGLCVIQADYGFKYQQSLTIERS